MLCLHFLVSAGYEGPAFAVILNSISPENKGLVVSALVFSFIMAGTLGSALLGWLEDYYNAENNNKLYGYLLCAIVAISYAVSIPFFWLAGKHYT